jgi:hypothetical protein
VKPKQDALDYIRYIHNPIKHAYAESYHAWILSGRPSSEEPLRPDCLNYMAAQTVRTTLISIYPVGHPDQTFHTL